MARPNPIDQKLQSVLYAMGVSLGKHGLDGIRGADTDAAVSVGAAMIGKSGKPEDMRKALVDQLKEPKFRNWALAKLDEMPKNQETIMAMQTVLAAAGHSTLYIRDPVTGLMNGKMNEATKAALANTRDGMPTSIAGVPDSAIQVAREEASKRGQLNDTFQMAVTAPSAQPPQPTQPSTQPMQQTKVALAIFDR